MNGWCDGIKKLVAVVPALCPDFFLLLTPAHPCLPFFTGAVFPLDV